MRPALLLHTDVSDLSGPLLSLRLDVVGINDGGEIRNYDGGGILADADGLAFGDLVVRGQLDTKTTASGEPYGWHANYSQPYSVDLRRARAMAKMLGKIERGLAKRDESDGYAETFAAYVIRVAGIIGADRFGWRRGEPTGWYSTGDYHWTDASGLTSEIRTRVGKFHREHGKVEA